MSKEKPSHIEKEQVELICPDCRLPISGDRPRTDVTRYLSDISRCQCNREPQSGSNGEPENANRKMAISVKVGFSVEDAREILPDRFDVVSFLGQGGMGSVFKVVEKRTGKIFAVKLLNPQLVNDEQSVRRFEQEAKAAMHLTHSNLTAVYEYGLGKDQSTPFLVMDYLEGKTLDQLLKKEQYLDYSRALDIFIQLCEAVSYAHLHGVIHRDIKPNNIMVKRTDRDIEVAKLFDFGIAKVLPNQAIDFTQDMTQTGDLFGSPLYMAPEQCKGLRIDERTDIYALGCVMYKTLSGRHPFEGKNFVDTVVKIITKEAEPLSDISSCDMLPRTLEQVIMRCLSKDPQYRYRNASLLQADLECVRDHKAISKMHTALKSTKSLFADKIAMVVLGITIAVAIGATGFVATRSGVPSAGPVLKGTNWTELAKELDNKALALYNSNNPEDVEKAVPLLEYGAKTYGKNDNYRAENIAHCGKCYLRIATLKTEQHYKKADITDAYESAVPYYRESLKMFQKWGNYAGGMMGETVNDYAQVLKGLDKNAEADAMLNEFSRKNNITEIP